MARACRAALDAGRPGRWRPATALLLAAVVAGCGGPEAPRPKEGGPAFSYDDDEIDPASLGPRKGKAGARGRP